MATSLSPIRFAAAVDALASAVRKGHPLIDTLGVTVNITELPSWTQYAKLRDRWQGPRWRHWLRRVFAPRRHKRLGRDFIQAQVWLQQELIDRVIEEGGNAERN